ncbi:conserved hypothetical protein [Hoeflea sp. EC-HK425]|nr:conserved hypothetical protein [Hoeflea sp. EC-HK425]|tara:strand:- start:131 stop:418 length:288 start_codon:yes stop_codon:yes gene_type:complete
MQCKDRKMKTSSIVALSVAAVAIVAGAFYFVEVDQTREARLPDVDVSVEGGQAPEFDVETGDVEVGTTEKKVLVPKVVMEEETVTVPTVEAEPAG